MAKPFDVVVLTALNFDYVVTGGQATEDTERICTEAEIWRAVTRANGGRAPEPVCGGSGFNALSMLAKLDLELRLGLVAVEASQLPSGAVSHVDKIEALHVRFLGETLSAAEPGLCASIASPNGRQLLVDPGSNVRIAEVLTPALLMAIRGTRVLHVTSFFEALRATDEPVADAVATFIETFRHQNPASVVTVDPGHPWTERAASPTVRRLLTAADMIFLNRTEFGLLTKGTPETDSMRRLYDIAPRLALHLLKNHDGVAGIQSAGLRTFEIDRHGDTEAVDPTGAGDAVAAGVLAALATDRTVYAGTALGLRMAELQVSAAGDAGQELFATRLGEPWPTIDPYARAESPLAASGMKSSGFLTLVGTYFVAAFGVAGLFPVPWAPSFLSAVVLTCLTLVVQIVYLRKSVFRARAVLAACFVVAVLAAVVLGYVIRPSSASDPESYSFIVTTKDVSTPVRAVPLEDSASLQYVAAGTSVQVTCSVEESGSRWYHLKDYDGWLREDEAVPAPHTGEGRPPRCPD